jgi:clan AA aspartic protease
LKPEVPARSVFKVNVTASNPANLQLKTPQIETLVDTGSELTWLPAEALEKAGISKIRKRSFQTATKQMVERDIGYAILRVDEFETVDEVVFAETGDMNLLGVRTLEGFGVAVDNIAHRFLVQTTLAV